MTASLLAYRAITATLSPFVGLILNSRVKKGKEDAARLQERKGYASRKRPNGKLIWMHGASIGESQVLLLLFDALRKVEPGLQAVMTTQTMTSAELIARKSPDGLIHQVAPLDTPFAAERFLKHWHPDLAVFAEGDIWPNLITKLDKLKIPRLLINARMTEKSFQGWMRVPALATRLFGGFDHIIAANQKTADFLKRFSRKRVKMPGNVKYAAPPLAVDQPLLERLKPIIGTRPVLAAISTHPEEEALVHRAFANCAKSMDEKPLLIIAPRHPERGKELVAEPPFDRGVYLRSRDGEPVQDQDIWICDTLGEVGTWITLSDVVFLGGGLSGSEIYGHNPIEPLKLRKHVISFDDVDNFRTEFREMVEAGAADLIADNSWRDLAKAILPYLKREDNFSADTDQLVDYLEADVALKACRDAVLDTLKRGKTR